MLQYQPRKRGPPVRLPFHIYFPLLCSGEAERIRQLEETIRSLSKELNTVQTTMQGINQRL